LEQAGVLEGDAQASREGGEEPDIRLIEGVLPIDVLERDHARRMISDDQRNEDGRSRLLARDDEGLSHRVRPSFEVFVDDDRLARLDRDPTEAGELNRVI